MDSYPGDLLAGVFPLIFAVDSILKQEKRGPEPTPPSPPKEDENANDFDNQDSDPNLEISSPSQDEKKQQRSPFDRFLDAMVGSILMDDQDDPANETRPNTRRNPRRSGSDALSSLLRGEDDDSSDDEDSPFDIGASTSSASKRFRVGIGSPGLGRIRGLSSARSSHTHASATSYGRSLKVDSFFHRARILPVSTKHGFPPSKDPTGEENRSLRLSQARSALAISPTNINAFRLKRVMDRHPIEGILPAGWLEKHVHALPSVLLVVTHLQFEDLETQTNQDLHVIETVEHLRESLAPKRDCSIRLVCLLECDIHAPMIDTRIDDWMGRVRSNCQLQSGDITLLQFPEDLLATSTAGQSSAPLKRLQKTLKDTSWQYYHTLMRRAKRKLSLLGHDQQPALLPLAIRYCFKIGVFYEFLLKHHKSLYYVAEAYRLLQIYYQRLVGDTLAWNPVTANAVVNPQGDDGVEAILGDPNNSLLDTNEEQPEGVEVALADNNDEEEIEIEEEEQGPIDIRKVFADIQPPPDMAHQCRAVADWLNFKLVQAGLQASTFSEADDGLLAASEQWRRHAQTFLKNVDVTNPVWHYWSYVCHQRHVMSQLVERFPPKPPSSVTGLAQDEVMLRCSAWRNYSAAAEAALRLGVEVRKAAAEHDNLTASTAGTDKASLRGRFVGSMDSEGLLPKLEEESKKDFWGIALLMLQRAIERFEAEIEQQKNRQKVTFAGDEKSDAEDAKAEDPMVRSGARMYYLIGGILLGRQKYSEAIVYLEMAIKYAVGWRGLELVIHRMLIECYEKQLPSQGTTTEEQMKTITSMILDSYFNAQMSSRNLRRALANFSTVSGGQTMKWYRECIDESDAALPFSFSVTFPGITHATAGDTVTACVWIRSNLDYAVHLNSLTLLSFAGKIAVPSNSLLSATNANEGKDGGIIIQAKTSILFSTQIDVPKDIQKIAIDESGNGGEKQGTPGKGSFSKSARPRCAGITSAAGARLLSEKLFKKGPNEQNAQWSLRYLGGKPLRCDGLRFVFYPVKVEKGAGPTSANLIELTIEKKKKKTAANIKRTPFEEDNYLASAWSRPANLPLTRGPRCLRVLGPMPQMIVTNLTNEITDGKAVEGTVNRILLKIQAGPTELCENVKFRLSCSSMLLCSDGTTKHLTTEENTIADIGSARVPSLVSEDPRVKQATRTDFGYSLPVGWKLLGTGLGTHDEVAAPSSSLKGGEETYIYFDIYRAQHKLPPLDFIDDAGSKRSTDNTYSTVGTVVDGDEICQTDFDLTISYRQARPKVQQRTRRRRKPPQMNAAPDSAASSEEDIAETVFLEYSGSVMWTSPLSADFDPVSRVQKAWPSGTRHPTNSTDLSASVREKKDNEEVDLIDGERLSTRCTLKLNEHATEGDLEVKRVWFQDWRDAREAKTAPCDLLLVSGKNNGSLFEPSSGEPARRLGRGKTVGIVYNLETRIRQGFRSGNAETNLGVICVDWSPTPSPVPQKASDTINNSANPPIARVESHGPLPLSAPSTTRFRGPPCYIETAPFSTKVQILPPLPKIGTPVEISISMSNNTAANQTIALNVSEKSGDDKVHMSDGILFSGMMNGEVRLSPRESATVVYTAVAWKAGRLSLPLISASSLRYKTWIVKGDDSPLDIFVTP